MSSVGVSEGAGSLGGSDAHRPLVVVRPDSGAGVLDVRGIEEREGLFRGDDLDVDVAVLSQWAWWVDSGREEGTDSEEFSHDERGLYGRDTAGRDEENVGVVG
jgi:hypothetical protein